jgi:hypothetical protein
MSEILASDELIRFHGRAIGMTVAVSHHADIGGFNAPARSSVDPKPI